MHANENPAPHFKKIMGLIDTHRVVLMLLLSKSGYGRTVADIVHSTGSTFQTVSMAKKKLLLLGYVEERHPFRDKRSTKVYLTEAGRKEARELWDLLVTLGQRFADHYHAEAPAD